MKALVLSGGASKGQYLIGALDYLLIEKKRQYDILCGVSIGAIVAGFAAQYSTGEERTLINKLKHISLDLTTADIHKRWPLGYLTALWKTGARSSKPLRKFIDSNISFDKIASSDKLLRVGATKLSGSQENPFKIFTEQSPDIVKAIMASSALSPFLEAVDINKEWYVDGGFQNPLPLNAAIEAGATEIDVVMCYPYKVTNFSYGKKLNTIDIVAREVDLVVHKLAWAEVKQTVYINYLVKAGASSKKYVKLNLIYPKHELNTSSLEFKHSDAVLLQALGFSDAKEYFNH